MNLTVLGCYGPYPPAGGACSGYLLEHENWQVLLDCGNGVLSRLQQFMSIDELDAVVLSHLHSDHMADCLILRHAVRSALRRGLRTAPLPVYAPQTPAQDYERLRSKDIFELHPLRNDEALEFGPFRFSFLRTIHSVSCFAVKVSLPDGPETMVYSADTEYFEELLTFARGATLFLCEASFLHEDLIAGEINHMSALQAARLAKNAEVERLVLTHLPPHRDTEAYLNEAKGTFESVQLAEEGEIYTIDSNAPAAGTNWRQLTLEADPIKAALLEGRLKAEGIPVFLRSIEAAGKIYGFTVGSLAEIRVFVPVDQIEAGRAVLKEIDETRRLEIE